MPKRRLPIGIQTFRQIREEGYYYVDKTTYARGLHEDTGKHYFLSRPRRFGKSLFVDTLKELFEGSEALFRGLTVHDAGWDWSRRHPVVACDAHVELTFIAGVSKFSKVSLFFDLNNLIDLTLEPDYAAICGYTEADLDRVFAAELVDLDRNRVREWYDGYDWLGGETVYNPFGILQLFRSRQFRAHWFDTATPRFLVDTLVERRFAAPDLEGLRASAALLSKFDVEDMATEALLFQTGYLTIRSVEEDVDGTPLYRLGYPNHEVRRGLNESLLSALTPTAARRTGDGPRLGRLLQASDFAGVEAVLRAFFASIPYEWHMNNDIARYEGYWASLFYAWFAALGFDVAVKASTNRGRLDMTVRFAGGVYLFEFKIVEQAGSGSALAQLKERGYAEKHRAPGRTIHLVGVEFSSEARNIVAFDVEQD